jgi:hypothetical protein
MLGTFSLLVLAAVATGVAFYAWKKRREPPGGGYDMG